MTRFVSIAPAALLATVFLSPASAADSKAYSGTYCKPALTSERNVDYPLGAPYGIRNNNGFTVPIICPILQDSVDNTGGTSSAFVHWTARYSSDRIVCALKSLNADGSVRQQFFGERIGTGWVSFPGQITSDDKYGSYVVDCQLFALGMVNTIWIEEKE